MELESKELSSSECTGVQTPACKRSTSIQECTQELGERKDTLGEMRESSREEVKTQYRKHKQLHMQVHIDCESTRKARACATRKKKIPA